MFQVQPLDADVPIFNQLQTEESPVILVNVLRVAEADIPAMLKAWTQDGEWMKRQPGFISTQLHQGIAGSTVFLNYAVWESVAHYRAAFNDPEFRAAVERYPASVIVSPHLFKRLSIPNLCVGP
jgi:heme-degrading monooxygenase HmoA